MISYELAKKLKDAGFPRKKELEKIHGNVHNGDLHYYPSLSELIEACGEHLVLSSSHLLVGGKWSAYKEGFNNIQIANTPEEAVAQLYLALNNAKIDK